MGTQDTECDIRELDQISVVMVVVDPVREGGKQQPVLLAVSALVSAAVAEPVVVAARFGNTDRVGVEVVLNPVRRRNAFVKVVEESDKLKEVALAVVVVAAAALGVGSIRFGSSCRLGSCGLNLGWGFARCGMSHWRHQDACQAEGGDGGNGSGSHVTSFLGGHCDADNSWVYSHGHRGSSARGMSLTLSMDAAAATKRGKRDFLPR
jgi:hypothetical protein